MGLLFPSVEILVATMHQTSLDFLWKMFAHNDHADFKILIINQTSINKQLSSNFDHITVINCFEYGIPKSRNLAISKATSDICLMADDDIVYEPNFRETIVEAHLKHPNAAMISFEAIDEHQQKYAHYYPAGTHSKASLKKIYTWVISFKREVYLKNKIFYNMHFGFGACFRGQEEHVFLRNAFDKGLNMVHVGKTIVCHPYDNSGKLMGSDDALFARSAEACRFYGNFSYLWLIKYVFFIYRHDYIPFGRVWSKFKMGLAGISKYKALSKSGEINSLYEA